MFFVSCILVSFLLPFAWHFPPLVLVRLSVHTRFLIFVFNISGLAYLPERLSLCTPRSTKLLHLHVHRPVWVCVCVCVCVRACVRAICVSFRCLVLCILSNGNVHKLHLASLNTHSSPKWGILRLGGQSFLHVVYMTGFIFKIIST
jgi:hypothetical protein